MPTLDATVGGVAANSYETLDEANTYFDERLALSPPWVTSGNTSVRALIMATRNIEQYGQPMKRLVPRSGSQPAYYVVSRQWTGQPASATQRLAWPRIGMFDNNGNAIASTVIPQELKDAESEFAGQLLKADRTLDNDVIVQGLTSLKVGSVSLAFKDTIFPQVVPDAVLNLLVPSWLTDELYVPANVAQFDVVSQGSVPWPDDGSL